MPIDPTDDLPHQQGGSLVEQWQFDFWSPEHDLGGWTHFVYDSASRSGWYVTALEDAMGNQWGERTGVGLDLEWERVENPEPTDAGFRQRCLITGEVLIDQEVIDINVGGWRSRSWGNSLGLVDRPVGAGIDIRVDTTVVTIEPDFLGQRWRGHLSE